MAFNGPSAGPSCQYEVPILVGCAVYNVQYRTTLIVIGRLAYLEYNVARLRHRLRARDCWVTGLG